MPEVLQEYWIYIAAVLVVLAIAVVWLMLASRRTKVEIETRPDDQGGAKRNQALIDAPAASAQPVSVAANRDDVAAAPVVADAEAGATATPAEAIAATSNVPSPPAAGETSGDRGDDLRRIKGLGPKLVSKLAEQGVTSFAQIAAWDDADIDRIDAQLGRFKGRIRRDNWVEQARFLAAGDLSGYESKFGNL